ncbi:MAG: hypothetical protein IT285_10805 [Bdellovibrionales bacterium]|nr:hypothetical protein [Bdellovibrionales bacterium]
MRRAGVSTCFGAILGALLAGAAWGGPVFAETPGGLPPSFTALRESPEGREQVSLIFRGAQVELVANSDFLIPSGERRKARVLGVLDAPKAAWSERALDLARETERELEARVKMEERMNAALGKAASEMGARAGAKGSPHRIRIFVGKLELPETSPDFPRVMSTLWQAQVREGWMPRDALEIRPTGAQKVELTPLGKSSAGGGEFTPEQLGCAPGGPGERRRCPIPGYGTHWFRP